MKMLWVGMSPKPSRRTESRMAEAKAAGHEVEYKQSYGTPYGKTETMIYFDELAEMSPEQQQQRASAEPTSSKAGETR